MGTSKNAETISKFHYLWLMEFEFRKVRIIRILFASLELYRVWNCAYGHYLLQHNHFILEEWFYLILTSVPLFLLIIGQRITASALVSAVVIAKFESVFGCGSISTNLFIFISLFIALFEHFVVKPQSFKPENDDSQLKTIDRLYWLLFLGYAFINFTSALIHLNNPYWQSGDAMEMMYTHSFWGRYFEFFRNLPATGKVAMHYLTWAVIGSQMVLIPLYLFKTTRKLLVVWCFILLFNILFLLRIVYLPHFTFLLFVLVFLRKENTLWGLQILSLKNVNRPIKNTILTFYAVLGLLFITRVPGVSAITDKFFWFIREWDTRVWIVKKTNQMGLGQPDVLNSNHLESHRRFVLYTVENEKKTIIPYLGINGERLSYKLDPLFFEHQGIEQVYSNCMGHVTGYDSFTYNNSPTPYKFRGHAIDRLITMDYFAQKRVGKVIYYAEFYERKHPSINGVFNRNYADTLKLSKFYSYSGAEW